MPSASSYLLHVFCFVENPYQTESNGIKTDEIFFGIYVIFGKKNQRDTMPEGATRQGGVPQGVRRALDPRGHPIRRLVPFFRRKKANIWIEIVLKFPPNRSYRSPRM